MFGVSGRGVRVWRVLGTGFGRFNQIKGSSILEGILYSFMKM